jgi:hypothetical protein
LEALLSHCLSYISVTIFILDKKIISLVQLDEKVARPKDIEACSEGKQPQDMTEDLIWFVAALS